MLSFPYRYRERYLGGMSLSAIRAIPDKESARVIIPTGAIEQHGPHLPVGVDSMLAQAWLNLALPRLPESLPVFVSPPLTYGKSNEHVGYPGTLSIDKREFSRILRVVVEQLLDWGFTQLGIFNTHGGNTSLLRYMARELHLDHPDLTIELITLGVDDWGLPKQEATYGFHAGTLETGWMLHVAPNLCDLDRAEVAYPASVEDPGELKPECAPATYAWVSADLAPSGIMGDPLAATPEKGAQWVQMATEGLVRNLLKWAGEES